MLSQGADVNAQNDVEDTSLHMAAWKGHVDVVELLLDSGADAKLLNKDGKKAADLVRGAPECAMRKFLPELTEEELAGMIEIAQDDIDDDDDDYYDDDAGDQ